ncbi:hypothetical protein Ancab_036316 [Ancistrocladus abbreviatus]
MLCGFGFCRSEVEEGDEAFCCLELWKKMRGVIAASPNSAVEARHRLSVSSEEPNKRRLQRNRDFKDVEKASHTAYQDRSFSFKFSTLKIVLVIIVVGTLLTLLHFTSSNHY